VRADDEAGGGHSSNLSVARRRGISQCPGVASTNQIGFTAPFTARSLVSVVDACRKPEHMEFKFWEIKLEEPACLLLHSIPSRPAR
jgi:hypothetical protein